MGIVVITTLGNSRKEFIKKLHQKTRNGVSIVIVKRTKPVSILYRIKKLLSSGNPVLILKNLFYAILLRLNSDVRESLTYFRESSFASQKDQSSYPPIIEVDSINSEEAYKKLKEMSPDLLVIWGSEIIKPHILNTAKKAINMHMGTCPYYRGNLCNQFAVLRNDFSNIGITIHYAVEKVDSGNILAVVKADLSKPPKDLFIDLNNRAQEKYLEIAEKLYTGEELPSEPQDTSLGKSFSIKQWTNETRYNLGKKIIKWEKEGLKNILPLLCAIPATQILFNSFYFL